MPGRVVTTITFPRTFLSRMLELSNGLPSLVFPQSHDMGLFIKELKYGLSIWQRGCNYPVVAVAHGRLKPFIL